MASLFSEEDRKALGIVAGWAGPALNAAANLTLENARGCNFGDTLLALVNFGSEIESSYGYINKAARLRANTPEELTKMGRVIQGAELRLMGDVIQALTDHCGCKAAS